MTRFSSGNDACAVAICIEISSPQYCKRRIHAHKAYRYRHVLATQAEMVCVGSKIILLIDGYVRLYERIRRPFDFVDTAGYGQRVGKDEFSHAPRVVVGKRAAYVPKILEMR